MSSQSMYSRSFTLHLLGTISGTIYGSCMRDATIVTWQLQPLATETDVVVDDAPGREVSHHPPGREYDKINL